MGRKEMSGVGSFLTDVAAVGGGVSIISGFILCGRGYAAMSQQVMDNAGGDGEITRSEGYNQGWERITNLENNYHAEDMRGTGLEGQYIEGSTEFISGAYGVGIGFLVWALAMYTIYRKP